MKVLMVGASSQGKRQYASINYGLDFDMLYENEYIANYQSDRGIICGMHTLVWNLMQQGKDPYQQLVEMVELWDGWVIICDEIGLGLEPVDIRKQKWRQEVGAICCFFASKADIVERITCGISQKIKDITV